MILAPAQREAESARGKASSSEAAPACLPPWSHPLRRLQKAVGNQAVRRLVQARLTVGAADDEYEREAERMSREVMSLPDAALGESLRRAASRGAEGNDSGGLSSAAVCRWAERAEEDEEDRIGMSSAGSLAGAFEAGDDLERQLSLSKGHGSPLPEPVRGFMEPRFGVDLGQVRVHDDGEAARMSAAIGAEAFTHGHDIYFGEGRGPTDLPLTAHELTHVIQQTGEVPLPCRERSTADGALTGVGSSMRCGDRLAEARVGGTAGGQVIGPRTGAGPGVRRYSLDEFTDDLISAGEAVAEGAEEVGSAIASGAEAVGETVVSGAEAVVDAGGDVLDWLATEAGELAQGLADSLGGAVSITTAGLVITIPRVCPLEATPHTFDLDSMDREYMVPVAALPLGTLAVTGEVGVAGHLQPLVQVQVGPFCLNGVRILINPVTNTYSISGSVSASAAASLGAEVRGGLRGALSLKGVVPIGEIPVPIDVPLAGIEGGLAGLLRGAGAGTVTFGGGLSIGGGGITLSDSTRVELGVAGDLYLGAYGQLDIEGNSVCRIYWQPWEWHGDLAGALDLSMGLTIVPGRPPRIIPTISPPTFSRIPFDQIPMVLSREGFSDDCPIKDRICEVLRQLGLLPSQNGGSWSWGGPYGPGPRLPGPLEVYQKNPGIPSGSECRGACGPNCDTCQSVPTHRYVDPATGDTWEYRGFQDCDSNGGCREHDAAFDWAAAVHGETGGWAIIMPWHMAANIECTCGNLAGNCIAWIAGLPPYDRKMFFAESSGRAPSGGGDGDSTGACHAQYPSAPQCMASFLDRDAFLEQWGPRNGLDGFRDHRVVEDWTGASFMGCDGAPGNVWHCVATDLGSGQHVAVSVVECICCKADDTSDSEWRQPQVLVDPGMSPDLILDLCERGLIPRTICIPIEEDMIGRFGNRRRDLNINPDEDPEAHPRPDDAPILDSFRRMYNRLDSWNFYIRANHPDWYPEFQSRFRVDRRREEWIEELKRRTKQFKEEFRNLRNTDPERARQDYERYVLGSIQSEIEQCNRDISAWYRDRTGSTESDEELMERVHAEGTELWRAAWRRAILQVNRVLARLWPPARTRILLWVGQQRARLPHLDLSGAVGELDYIGSLATGYKGPPKQQIRFNPDSFDVDANLSAPPLAKYAIAVDGARPDRQRIFGRTTSISPLNEFSSQAHGELSARVDGYNTSDPFDVAIESVELPEQERERRATERLYGLRDTLSQADYARMLDELTRGGYLQPGGTAVREDLSNEQFNEMNAIMDRYSAP